MVTFDNLVRKTPFVKIMDEMLTKLEKGFGYPIDTEFTGHINDKGEVRICLLQCRSLAVPGVGGPVALPEDIKREMVLFRSANFTSGGIVKDVRYILYMDPLAYSRMASADRKKTLGRMVGLINNHPSVAEGKIIMMGPARWGSSNLELGVNVGFSDICNAAVLVELAREDRGHVPEVSYGTHFFLDLVENQIIYLPVYPSDPETQFNTKFFANAPNVLTSLLPDVGSYADIIRLIDVPASIRGITCTSGCRPALPQGDLFPAVEWPVPCSPTFEELPAPARLNESIIVTSIYGAPRIDSEAERMVEYAASGCRIPPTAPGRSEVKRVYVREEAGAGCGLCRLGGRGK